MTRRGAKILLALAALQNFPDFFRRSQTTLLQALSTASEQTGRPVRDSADSPFSCGCSRSKPPFSRPSRSGARATRTRRRPIGTGSSTPSDQVPGEGLHPVAAAAKRIRYVEELIRHMVGVKNLDRSENEFAGRELCPCPIFPERVLRADEAATPSLRLPLLSLHE